ncbi:MAG: helix-turn-helix domain-containing protein [Bacteroidaceae bacterium]|nr:helix-turn-helix domain-containing protein [Bacteroidaceae bacterium]
MTVAAKHLNVSRCTLYRYLKKYTFLRQKKLKSVLPDKAL